MTLREKLPGPSEEEQPVSVVLEELVREIAAAAVATSSSRNGVRALVVMEADDSSPLSGVITAALKAIRASTSDASMMDMLARRYERRFSRRIPWDDIWVGHLYQTWPDTSGMTNPPDLPLRSPRSSPTARSSALLASFPPELLRQKPSTKAPNFSSLRSTRRPATATVCTAFEGCTSRGRVASAEHGTTRRSRNSSPSCACRTTMSLMD